MSFYLGNVSHTTNTKPKVLSQHTTLYDQLLMHMIIYFSVESSGNGTADAGLANTYRLLTTTGLKAQMDTHLEGLQNTKSFPVQIYLID